MNGSWIKRQLAKYMLSFFTRIFIKEFITVEYYQRDAWRSTFHDVACDRLIKGICAIHLELQNFGTHFNSLWVWEYDKTIFFEWTIYDTCKDINWICCTGYDLSSVGNSRSMHYFSQLSQTLEVLCGIYNTCHLWLILKFWYFFHEK